MLDRFDPFSLLLLAQAQEGAPAAAPEGGLFGSPFSPLLILALGAMFYLMVLRPENRRRAEMQKLVAGVKKNDEVLTVGGMWGVVVNAPQDSEYVWLRLDENSNSRVKVLRSSISRVLTAEKAAEKDKEKAGEKTEVKDK